jgi:hypothetical protein
MCIGAYARKQLVFMSGMNAPALYTLHQISAHNQTVADQAADKKTFKQDYPIDLNVIIKPGTAYA